MREGAPGAASRSPLIWRITDGIDRPLATPSATIPGGQIKVFTRSGLTLATVSSTLMRLEMKRQIRALPGRRYSLLQ